MDILGMLVRQDRVKELLVKKKKEWTDEEKAKETGGPIEFGDDDDDFWDLILDTDDDEEEDEEETTNSNSDLPTFDFVYKPPTIEEKVQQRLDTYERKMYAMPEIPFVKLCIREGVLSENTIY